MLTGTMVLKRAMVLTALALSTSAMLGDATTAAAAPATPATGTSCTPEQWSWTGATTLDAATPAFDTGVIVPVQLGTDLIVVGVSADGLTSTGAARAMPVTVGGVAAVAGATVPGGRVVVMGDGSAAEVRNVTVQINRCAQVQSAAPADPAPAPVAGASGTPLPHTGATGELSGSLIGAAAIALGTALMVLGKRRATA
ncbi:MAG: hypothetical protein JWN99_1731 [Ilumatobacteraceae bacterium]|nr:hypothetical protein [Ilumatobacteraceae bacterium]